MDKFIDLRSDTVTKPSLAMRKAMAEAQVGDDVFSEDPTVHELEAETAAILGKEAALYAPSGCMANQLAIAVHTTAGDEVILESDAHIFNYETTAASYLSRVQLSPVKAADRGLLSAEDIQPAIREKAYYMPVTRLIAIENTHNRAGGTVYPLDRIREIESLARKNGIAMHLDGARLWNACAFSGHRPKEYADHFDTVSVCFSKGLGAPVGSAIAGPKELIALARRFRKIWGGGMRQAGIIAAGALFALRNNRERLAEDHAKARRFAEIILDSSKHVQIDMNRVETN
ncbi:MAG TPA: GntG family PLP-dependent aldolase, partial [Candidatus Kapabacteria bacterium]|nr:GntG family PLP-dependent aldolase [Candidatus Kapabacteria bacterium]